MTNAIKAAAKERAVRTFMQNIWIDLCVMVGPLLYDVVANADSFSKEYWLASGLSVGKTAALVIIAYVMRLKKQPQSEVARPTR